MGLGRHKQTLEFLQGTLSLGVWRVGLGCSGKILPPPVPSLPPLLPAHFETYGSKLLSRMDSTWKIRNSSCNSNSSHHRLGLLAWGSKIQVVAMSVYVSVICITTKCCFNHRRYISTRMNVFIREKWLAVVLVWI